MTKTTERGGFTMVELLLVVVIMLLAAALGVPSFVRSYRGAKLRTSARTVVMAHRYARAMAVLKQVEVAVLYDSVKNELEIISAAGASRDDREQFLDDRGERTGVEAVDQQAEKEAAAAAGPVTSELIRPLADGVKIDSFESDNARQEKEGIYWVRYYTTGMCDEYEVRLRDELDKTATIRVDPLSGKAKVEYE